MKITAGRGCLLILLIAAILIAISIARSAADTSRHDLRDFDPHEAAKLELSIWQAAYSGQSARMFGGSVRLLRHQYHLPFWRAASAANQAIHASRLFAEGHNHADFERALPGLQKYYAVIRRSSVQTFDPDLAASLQLEAWIVYRELASHSPADLEHALAAVPAATYQIPPEALADYAHARAAAMLRRDKYAAEGNIAEADWAEIGGMLDTTWAALQTAVGPPK